MEMFPSLSADPLEHISATIDNSDAYLLIIGSRYGTVHPRFAKSFTQLEYEYAVTRNPLPIHVLLHTDSGREPDGADKQLAEFRAIVSAGRAPGRWKTVAELERESFLAVSHAISKPIMPGWVRATPGMPETPFPFIPNLAGLDDEARVNLAGYGRERGPAQTTWRQIFRRIAPHIRGLTAQSVVEQLLRDSQFPDVYDPNNKGCILDTDLFSIRAQLSVMNLISCQNFANRIGVLTDWWKLTASGEMLELMEYAQRKP